MNETAHLENGTSRFECQRCGRCCLHFGWLTAFPKDIARWQNEGRDDILRYADLTLTAITGGADLWFHPETGDELFRCPFLRKVRNKPMYRCLIYDTRPLACQRFPHAEYNDEGELIATNPWATQNCPGVKKLLEGWPPEQVRALQKGKLLKKLPGGSSQFSVDRGRKTLADQCAGARAYDDADAAM